MKNKRLFDKLRGAAAVIWPTCGAWIYDAWADLNQKCFDDKLHPIGLMFGLTPHGKALAFYRPDDKTITLHTSLLQPRSKSPWGLGSVLGQTHARDVLLHEMIHQSNDQMHGTVRERMGAHNNQMWVDEVNRIAPILGLKPNACLIKQKRVRGKVKWVKEPDCMARTELATWPLSMRPRSFYR